MPDAASSRGWPGGVHPRLQSMMLAPICSRCSSRRSRPLPVTSSVRSARWRDGRDRHPNRGAVLIRTVPARCPGVFQSPDATSDAAVPILERRGEHRVCAAAHPRHRQVGSGGQARGSRMTSISRVSLACTSIVPRRAPVRSRASHEIRYRTNPRSAAIRHAQDEHRKDRRVIRSICSSVPIAGRR